MIIYTLELSETMKQNTLELATKCHSSQVYEMQYDSNIQMQNPHFDITLVMTVTFRYNTVKSLESVH